VEQGWRSHRRCRGPRARLAVAEIRRSRRQLPLAAHMVGGTPFWSAGLVGCNEPLAGQSRVLTEEVLACQQRSGLTSRPGVRCGVRGRAPWRLQALSGDGGPQGGGPHEPAEEMAPLLGPNGAGKTMLIGSKRGDTPGYAGETCQGARAMSSKCCANRWRRVSYTYNLTGVLDLNTFVGSAIKVMAVMDSGSAG
jgi:hypothetical protein